YRVAFHGQGGARDMQVNGAPVDTKWDAQKHLLSLDTGPLPVNAQVVIEPRGAGAPGADGGTDDSGAGGPGDTSPVGGTGGGSSGCGCRTSRADGSFALGALALALALLRRRR